MADSLPTKHEVVSWNPNAAKKFIFYGCKNNPISASTTSFIVVTHKLVFLPLIRHTPKSQFAQLLTLQE
jgi:hypothetical protein